MRRGEGIHRVRISLDVARVTKKRLERVQELSGAGSLTEAVRISIICLEAILDAGPGARVLIVRPDGRQTELKVLA